MNELENLKQKYQQAKEEYFNYQKEHFPRMFDKLFEKGVEGIRWTQYTPYFNDGESCEFSVNENIMLDFGEGFVDEYELYYEWVSGQGRVFKNKEEEIKSSLIEKASELVSEVEEDVMYDLFGDHVQVTVTPSGVEVDEYDHD